MYSIVPIQKNTLLPEWFEKKRWRDAVSGVYLDSLDNFLVAMEGSRIIGAAQFVHREITGKLHFGSLYVKEQYRGKRIGQGLFRALINRTGAREVCLDTSKPGLIPYYEQLGFVRIEENLDVLKEELFSRHPDKDLEKQIYMRYRR